MSAKPMVAATDGSEESLRAVDWAAREAVLRGAPLRIVSAAAELSGMMGRHDGPHVETVTDVLSENRDQALATAAARAAKVSPDLLVDTDRLPGAPAEAVALYERSGFVTVDRFELHPGTESLLMQWDNRPAPQEDPG